MKTAISQATAGDIMTRDLLTVPATMTAGELARYFTEREISAAPVVDARGVPVGVVSTFDLTRLAGEGVERSGGGGGHSALDDEMSWELYGLDRTAPPTLDGAEDTPVGDFMTTAVQSVDPSTSLPELARLMVAGHHHRLFVHDDSGLIGVVTSMDVLGAVAEGAG